MGRQWHPAPVFLPGESRGWRSLVGCRLWHRTESDMTERLHFHFSLSCMGEGNGTLLQCSCLENPRDGGAWWAAVYGIAQSQTQLKQLSSSSSSVCSVPRTILNNGQTAVTEQTCLPLGSVHSRGPPCNQRKAARLTRASALTF